MKTNMITLNNDFTKTVAGLELKSRPASDM